MKNIILILTIVTSQLYSKKPIEIIKYKGDYVPNVRLEITTNKEVCKQGDSLELSYTFRNMSNTYPLKIWEHFWLNCYLVILDEQGKEVFPKHWTHIAHPDIMPKAFHTLWPKEFVGKTKILRTNASDINECYDLAPCNTYTVYCSLSVGARKKLIQYVNNIGKNNKYLEYIMEDYLFFDYSIKDKTKDPIKYYSFDMVWEGDITSNKINIKIAE